MPLPEISLAMFDSRRLPVEPCEHYMIGGVATDLWGRTTVPGLWAAGEAAAIRFR